MSLLDPKFNSPIRVAKSRQKAWLFTFLPGQTSITHEWITPFQGMPQKVEIAGDLGEVQPTVTVNAEGITVALPEALEVLVSYAVYANHFNQTVTHPLGDAEYPEDPDPETPDNTPPQGTTFSMSGTIPGGESDFLSPDATLPVGQWMFEFYLLINQAGSMLGIRTTGVLVVVVGEGSSVSGANFQTIVGDSLAAAPEVTFGIGGTTFTVSVENVTEASCDYTATLILLG